ncbi:hypothetical protein N8085_01345 [Salibacteraceae bacterium]|nr:hypothetical protein [Bacteroidota bacterium]MDB0058063.1 hypothetical protein [Salibacteraceae bacterium]MDC1204028.1 hypothetical protein [Salibacteraceae bacterium]
MKKYRFLLIATLSALALSSCKKNYECCYFDTVGEKIVEGDFTCGEKKMTEQEVTDLEVRMNDAATEWNGSGKCEPLTEVK